MTHQIYIKLRNVFPVCNNKLISIINESLVKRGKTDKFVELWVVGKKRMRTLNNKFMHKDRPTDVLSFPLESIPAENRFNFELIGTIVVCNDIINTYAKESGNSFVDETSKLVSHGVDHLLGIHHK